MSPSFIKMYNGIIYYQSIPLLTTYKNYNELLLEVSNINRERNTITAKKVS